MLIEWNAHMFSRDQGRYPFHRRAAYEGIDRAVLGWACMLRWPHC